MTEKLQWQDMGRVAIAIVVLLVCLPLLVLAAPILAIAALWRRFDRRRLAREIGDRWHGRRLLLVYSDSPVWQAYVEANWLPRLSDLAVVLNWSARKRWPTEHAFEARVFRRWAGRREYNPIAIAFLPDGRVEVVRFWKAFRDFKHGKSASLRAAEARLEEIAAALRAAAGEPGATGPS